MAGNKQESITLSAATFNAGGSVRLHVLSDKSELDTNRRRVSRVATLDGGAVITDSGHSDGDRTIKANVKPITVAQADILRDLRDNYSSVICSVRAGCFSGVISKLKFADGRATIEYLVKEKVSA